MTRQTETSGEAFLAVYGPWAIITGASSGIGEAFAHAVAARGLRLILVARRLNELERVAGDVRALHGVDCVSLALDLGDMSSIDALVAACENRDVGLIIGNAAYNPLGGFLDISREAMLRMLDVNDRANLLLAHAFLPRLQARGRGGFLLVGSTEAFSGTPYAAVYSATKAFILALGEALWGEFVGSGVHILVLSPNATDTPLLATRDMGDSRIKVMLAREVAEIGLRNLQKGPAIVPGAANRWTFRILRRLPRHWVVRTIGKAMHKILLRSAPNVNQSIEMDGVIENMDRQKSR